MEKLGSDACRRQGIPLTLTDPEGLRVLGSGREGQTFTYRDWGTFHISLLGRYQLYNAATALEVVAALVRRGWRISEEAVTRGLRAAVWPARMELVRRNPDMILDGGHNPQCMGALRRALEELYPNRKILFMTGVLSDKDYPSMLGELLPLSKGFVTITPDSDRALSAGELAQYLRQAGAEAQPCGSVSEGIRTVLDLAQPDDVVCVCGSLYMIGEARHALGLC